jgi:hypothetical protein
MDALAQLFAASLQIRMAFGALFDIYPNDIGVIFQPIQ